MQKRYGIELYFGDEFSEAVEKLWHAVDSNMLLTGTKPHISLASFVSTNPKSIEEIIEKISKLSKPFELMFTSVGIFEGDENVLFLSPAPRVELLMLHQHCYELLEATGQGTSSYYHPSKWTPHCTIKHCTIKHRTIKQGVPKAEFADVVSKCKGSNVFGLAKVTKVTKVALVEYRPAITLFEFHLLPT